ncbi:alpha-1,2-fucosyltransferase [Butyrivibrio fibrisolvens]|uniref:alpha-1,2-fucosyltransferase n=1 Tax=Butyrivibrio fibrisolvens TaxID=831 RepID=UPI0006844F7F|nr:alpha-1,2-fucosyltransferase [Butyrivibrio fibrisolvens]
MHIVMHQRTKMGVILNYSIGLGNELNLYALYWVLKERGVDVKFDDPEQAKRAYYSKEGAVHHLTLQSLDVDDFDICSAEEKKKYLDCDSDILNRLRRKIFGSKSKIIKEEDVKSIDDITEGYFIGNFPVFWTYEYLDVIKKHIKFKQPLGGSNKQNIEIAKEMSSNNSVSIHFRRTDYLRSENSFLNITNDDYYDKAISFIETKYNKKNMHYYIFSDDKEYIRKKYDDKKYTIIDWNDGEDGIWDFWLMTKCKHNICANSSFSTWASLLNDNQEKTMIRPIRKDAPRWYYDSLKKMGYDLIEV